MKHDEYTEQLSALLDGELDDAARADVLAHLDGCEACRAYLAELTALHTALGEPDELDAPEGFADGVLARLRAERDTKNRAPWRVWGALAACAAVVVLAVTALPRMGGASGKTADSAAPETVMTTESAVSYGASAADSGAAEDAAPAEAEERALSLTKNAAEAPATGTAGGAAYTAEDAEEPPTLTLEGEGAAEWLANNGWQGESGDWYADAALLRALPEGAALAEEYEGAVRVELGVAE